MNRWKWKTHKGRWNLFKERNDGETEDCNEKIYNLHVILVLIIAHEMF